MTHVLIIGGNHGLGLEWTKYFLAQDDTTVTATFRNEAASQELFAIENERLRLQQCDVTNKAHAKALPKTVPPPDLIIYNTGTKGYKVKFSQPEQNTDDELELALAVNCTGADRIIRAFFPTIKHKPDFQFVYMSTGVSNTQGNASGGYHPYRSSKAAGNAIVRNWDITACKQWIEKGNAPQKRPTFFALTPGLVNIGMGAGVKGAMPPEQALSNMHAVINHVRITKDSHALWSHRMTKLERYVLPNVLKDLPEIGDSAQIAIKTEPQASLLTSYAQKRNTTTSASKKARATSTQPFKQTRYNLRSTKRLRSS